MKCASSIATPRGRKRAPASTTRSLSTFVPRRHCSASGFNLAPPQASHGVYARYFDSSTRMCILYALLSSQAKKRFTPYHVPGQDLLQLTHSASPSRTQRRECSSRSRHGTSSAVPRFFAYLARSSWHSLKLLLCHGLTAPSRNVFAGSGTMRP